MEEKGPLSGLSLEAMAVWEEGRDVYSCVRGSFARGIEPSPGTNHISIHTLPTFLTP